MVFKFGGVTGTSVTISSDEIELAGKPVRARIEALEAANASLNARLNAVIADLATLDQGVNAKFQHTMSRAVLRKTNGYKIRMGSATGGQVTKADTGNNVGLHGNSGASTSLYFFDVA
jgi:hypothetical protein